MLLAVRISSYGCTWEVWRSLKKLENSYASLVLSKLILGRCRRNLSFLTFLPKVTTFTYYESCLLDLILLFKNSHISTCLFPSKSQKVVIL